MAKKSSSRKSKGIASIATIEASDDEMDTAGSNGEHVTLEADDSAPAPAKKARKTKPESASGENYSVGDIRKAAAFAKSVGSLDKAIAVLQILKVAKEVL